MAEGPQLTDSERTRIDAHARRLAAFVALRKLVEGWRRELELQDKANAMVARTLGALVAIASAIVALYLAHLAYDLVNQPTASAILKARMSMWYAAGIGLCFSAFCFGMFYVTFSMPRRLYIAAVGAIPISGLVFFFGLLVAPFLAWLLAS